MVISDIMNSKTFTPTSNYLLDFLDSHISHKLEGFQKTKLSIESKKIITLLFNKIKLANENLILPSPSTITIQHGNDYDLIDENIKIHIEASKIFSFGAFKVCKEINLRIANSRKKLANNKFKLLKMDGKTSRNNKKNKIV